MSSDMQTIYGRHIAPSSLSHTTTFLTRELSWFGRRISWFIDAPQKGRIYRVVAPLIAFVGVIVLTASLIGAPLALYAIKEYTEQKNYKKYADAVEQNKRDCSTAQDQCYSRGRLAPFENDNIFYRLDKVRPQILKQLEIDTSDQTTADLFRRLILKDPNCIQKLGLSIRPA